MSKWVWLLLKSKTEQLVLANKVSTVDNPRRGIVLEPMFEVYILCGRDGETVKSLFLQPIFTSYIRGPLHKKCGLLWCLPSSLEELPEALRAPFWDCNLLPCRIALWPFFGPFGQRNDRISRGASRSTDEMLQVLLFKDQVTGSFTKRNLKILRLIIFCIIVIHA